MRHRKLYLIHIENQNGKRWHYVGVTAHETIKQRLTRHMWGDTKSFNHLEARGAKDIKVWQVQANADLGQEKMMQMFDEQTVREFICPRCREQREGGLKNAPPSLLDLEEQEEVIRS